MEYISGTREFKITKKRTIITLGKFDGLHRGHQKLLEQVLEEKTDGYATVVFTFDMSPYILLTGKPHQTIITNEERRAYLEKMGIDYLIEYPFNREVEHLSPEDFIRKVLIEQLNVGCIVVGTDFHFGYKRKGDISLLAHYGIKFDYKCMIIEKKKDEESGRIISSSYIRENIQTGNIEKVNYLLGYPYTITGEILHGNQIGRTMGLPTINQIPKQGKMLPPNGVYCSKTTIDGVTYKGITNIGYKPTVSSEKIKGVETHLFDFDMEVYGKVAQVMLYHFKRPEQTFNSLEELKNQINDDVKYGKKFLL